MVANERSDRYGRRGEFWWPDISEILGDELYSRGLVRPNYGYCNAALPRSAPQVLIITGIKRCFDTADKYNLEANSQNPSGRRANRALVEKMDKDAIRARLR